MRLLSFFLTLCMAGLAGDPGKQVSCATCHPHEAASQPHTPMGRALLTPGQNPTLEARNKLTFTKGKYSYLIETRNHVSTYSVSDGAHSLSLPIEWTFGAGAQTYVLNWKGRFLESMVSYYAETGALDITVGDQRLDPQSLEEALGRPLEPSVITSCFGCHSTHSVSDHKLTLATITPGITCERCHLNASAHLKSMSHPGGRTDTQANLPERLGQRSTESLANFCGQCHRSWETVVRNNWRGQMNVRFQPYRLANSPCFDGTDPRISCVACHNPHEDLVRDDTKYDAKCLACHSSGGEKQGRAVYKACPVSQTRCTTCHMPKVQLPGGHQTFTDHYIRVVKKEEPYPN